MRKVALAKQPACHMADGLFAFWGEKDSAFSSYLAGLAGLGAGMGGSGGLGPFLLGIIWYL